MRIDVHAHYWTEDYLDRLVELGKSDTANHRGIGAGPGEELDDRLRLMDRCGVQMQVLSAAPQLPYGPDLDAAVAAARSVNDQYAALVEHYPERFRAFAATPMPHIEASVLEIERALDELAMVGVAMNTTVLDRALVEPDFEPIFAELDRRAAVLFLHPAGNSACTPLISQHGLTWMVGAIMEDTIAAMQLITHGVPSRYPNIKIITSHLGGALPMLVRRADNQYLWEAPGTPEKPSAAARRMWYDTVSHGHGPALRCAIDSFGADRLLLGTDFPYEAGDVFVRAVDYVNDLGISEDDAEGILERNAAALLGITHTNAAEPPERRG